MAADITLWPPLSPPLVVTQPFGAWPEYYGKFGLRGHDGVDLRAGVGTPVYAGVAGHVSTGWTHQSGVVLRIYGPLGTLYYSHLSEILVPADSNVLPCTLVARSGNTGASTTGAHLHVGWYPSGEDYNNGYQGAVDPWPMLERGLMELEKASHRADKVVWELEQAQREDEEAIALDKEADELHIKADGLRMRARGRRAALISMQGGLAHGVKAALGLPVPAEWEEP